MSAQDEVVLRIRSIMETGDIRSAVKEIEGYFGKMNLSKSMKGEFDGIFDKLLKEVDTFEEKSQSSFKKASDVSALEKSAEKIENLFGKIIQNMSKLDGMDIEDLINIDTTEIKKISDEIEKLEKKIKGLTSLKLDFGAESFKGISKSGQIGAFFDNFESGKIDQAGISLKALQQNVLAFGTSIQGSAADVKKAEEALQKYSEALQSGDFDKIRTAILNLDQALQKTGDTSNLTKFVNKVNAMTQAWAEAKDEVKQTTAEISRLETQKVEALSNATERAAQQWEEMKTSVKGTSENVRGYVSAATSAASRTNDLNKEMDEIKNRVKYFLSLENAVDLFRRGVQKAFETVKELDKAMTETAVVTNFSVGDMWDQLPKYSQMAKELGVSMQGVYEASTLYYQQGLKQEEVMSLTTETLKMARIAGLDCAEATDLMTAALRGFNMEINEASAQKVNDIYSELAAITAADTQEIATAMTKTASIAHSANMELETTAALLAQMIETTREPAETAGTAMKTIVARFTEMKKAVGDTVTVDGEEVNVNKVEAALKSAGVALRDAKGEFRDLDDVFLDLAKRWNSLDIMTQRYIATTAAGSRQQSRFIAMMQDYDRTMELVDAAYSSAGASTSQFAKTQESLESKLANLQTAWQEFLMGIANSDAIKGLVDALTGFLNILNKASTGVGGFSTFVLRMFTIITTLKVGKGIFAKLFSGIGSQMRLGGQQAGAQFTTGMLQGMQQGTQTLGERLKSSVKTLFKGGLFKSSLKSISKEMGDSIGALDFAEKLEDSMDFSQIQAKAPQIAEMMQSSLGTALNQNDLTQEGQLWADGLLKSFQQRIQSGEMTLKQATEALEQEVAAGLTDGSDLYKTQEGYEKALQTSGYTTPIDDKGKPQKPTTNIQIPKESIENAKKLKVSMDGVGMALSGAGMAINLITSGLKEAGVISEDVAKGIESLSSGLSTAGTMLMTLTSIQKLFNNATWANPYIAAIAIFIGAITTVASLIGQAAEKQKELNDAATETANDSAEEVREAKEQIKAYNELLDAYKETGEGAEDLQTAKEELIETLDLERYGVNALTSSYEEVAEAAEKARIEMLKTDRINQEAGLQGATSNAVTEGSKPGWGGAGWTGGGSSFEIDMGGSDSQAKLQEIITDIAAQEGLENLSFTKTGTGNLSIEGLDNSAEGRYQWMKIMSQVMSEYQAYLSDSGKDSGDSTAYQAISEYWGAVSEYYENSSQIAEQQKETEKGLATEAIRETQVASITSMKEFEVAVDSLVDDLKDFDLTEEEKRAIAIDKLTLDDKTLENYALAYQKVLKLANNSTEEEFNNFIEGLTSRDISIIVRGELQIDEDSTIGEIQTALEEVGVLDAMFGQTSRLKNITSYQEKLISGEVTEEDKADMRQYIVSDFGEEEAKRWDYYSNQDISSQNQYLNKLMNQKIEEGNKSRQKYVDTFDDQIAKDMRYAEVNGEYDAKNSEYGKDKAAIDIGREIVSTIKSGVQSEDPDEGGDIISVKFFDQLTLENGTSVDQAITDVYNMKGANRNESQHSGTGTINEHISEYKAGKTKFDDKNGVHSQEEIDEQIKLDQAKIKTAGLVAKAMDPSNTSTDAIKETWEDGYQFGDGITTVILGLTGAVEDVAETGAAIASATTTAGQALFSSADLLELAPSMVLENLEYSQSGGQDAWDAATSIELELFGEGGKDGLLTEDVRQVDQYENSAASTFHKVGLNTSDMTKDRDGDGDSDFYDVQDSLGVIKTGVTGGQAYRDLYTSENKDQYFDAEGNLKVSSEDFKGEEVFDTIKAIEEAEEKGFTFKVETEGTDEAQKEVLKITNEEYDLEITTDVNSKELDDLVAEIDELDQSVVTIITDIKKADYEAAQLGWEGARNQAMLYSQALGLINSDYTVNAENMEQLYSMVPEFFEGATRVGDKIQLSQQVVDDLTSDAATELDNQTTELREAADAVGTSITDDAQAFLDYKENGTDANREVAKSYLDTALKAEQSGKAQADATVKVTNLGVDAADILAFTQTTALDEINKAIQTVTTNAVNMHIALATGQAPEGDMGDVTIAQEGALADKYLVDDNTWMDTDTAMAVMEGDYKDEDGDGTYTDSNGNTLTTDQYNSYNSLIDNVVVQAEEEVENENDAEYQALMAETWNEYYRKIFEEGPTNDPDGSGGTKDQEEKNALKEREEELTRQINEELEKAAPNYEKVNALMRERDSLQQNYLDSLKDEEALLEKDIEKQIEKNEEAGMSEYFNVEKDGETYTVVFTDKYADLTPEQKEKVDKYYAETVEIIAKDAVVQAEIDRLNKEGKVELSDGSWVDPDRAQKDYEAELNNTLEDQEDLERTLSGLQDDQVKNYPLILAYQARQIALKKKEVAEAKKLLELEKAKMKARMAAMDVDGYSKYAGYDLEKQELYYNSELIQQDLDSGVIDEGYVQNVDTYYDSLKPGAESIDTYQDMVDDGNAEIQAMAEEMVSTAMEMVSQIVDIIVRVAEFISEIAAGIKEALLSALTEQEFWLENTFRRMEALAARQERLLTKNEQVQAGLLSTVGNMEGNYNQRWENLQQQYITAKKIVRDTEDYLTSDLEYAANKMKSAINDAFNGSSGVNVNLGSLSSSKGGLDLPDWIPDKLNPGKWLNLPTIDNLIGSATGLITGILTDSWTTTYKHEDYDGTVGGYLQTNSDLTLAQNLALGLMSNSTLLGPLADTLQTMQDHANETLEAAYDAHEEYTDKMLELEQQMLEMVKEGVEEATAFEDSVMEAYTAQKQAEIDELSRLNDSISNANSALISTLQDNLSKMREERELDKTKEDISDKERRLAYLRQDTSGANKLEILKLEEELEDSRESYTDKLIDKKINELQEQNDKAAEQRQQQIDLLQSQLDYSVKYGLYWNEIYAMLAKDSNFSNGYVAKNSDLAKLLSTYGSTETLSKSIWGTTVAREAFELAGFNYQTFIKRNGLDGSWDLQHVLEAIPKALEEEDKYFTYTDVSGNTVTKTGEGDNDYVFKNKKGQIITDSEIINSLKDAWDRTNLYQSNIASALGVSQQDLDTTTAAALSAAAITASIAQGTADTVAKYLPMILEAVQTGIGFAQTAIQSVIAMIDMFGALSAAFGAVNPFAVGTPFLKQDTLALVHKGEMIIPARYNPENNPNIGLVSKGLLVGESAHAAAAQKNLTTQNNREFSQNVNIIIEEINENVDVDMVIQKITDTLNTNLRYITNI